MHENARKIIWKFQINCRKYRKLVFFVLGMAEDTPALLDGVIDSSHRSFLSVVLRVKLNMLRPRHQQSLFLLTHDGCPGDMSSDYVSENMFVSYTFPT